MDKIKSAVFIFLFIFMSGIAEADQVILTWTNPTATDLGSNTVCYGYSSRTSPVPPANYSACINVGTNNSVGISGLKHTKVYFSVYSCDNIPTPNCSKFGAEYSAIPMSLNGSNSTTPGKAKGGF